MAAFRPSHLAVIGIGNEFRQDDGVGILAARRLRTLLPADIAVYEESGEGARLMDCWSGYTDVIVIDAVNSGGRSGSIHRLDASRDEIPRNLFNYSTHTFSLAEAVETARVLDRLPARCLIFGIEGEFFGFGAELSEPVAIALEKVIQEIEQMVFQAEAGQDQPN
jgi:hydrogenase maturation protease